MRLMCATTHWILDALLCFFHKVSFMTENCMTIIFQTMLTVIIITHAKSKFSQTLYLITKGHKNRHQITENHSSENSVKKAY